MGRPLPLSVRQASGSRSAVLRAHGAGLSALRRRPCGAVRSSRSARATKADDGCPGGWMSPCGKRGAAGAPSAGGDAAAHAVGGAPVWDDAKVVGCGLLLHARSAEGSDGVQLDRAGVQPPTGVEPCREAAAASCPQLRWTWAQCGGMQASLSGEGGSLPMQASGCRTQRKTCNGGFSHSLARRRTR